MPGKPKRGAAARAASRSGDTEKDLFYPEFGGFKRDPMEALQSINALAEEAAELVRA